jgi:amino acid adenylation domain-containing protein/thioester reductase-like protein
MEDRMITPHGSLIDAAWNGSTTPYPSNEGLAELLALQVAARPGAVAIDAGAERITYAALDRRANQMAHTLRGLGVGVETPVGVFMGPRAEQIIAQVAILKVGGTYVPLDPDYPRERLEFMVADAEIQVILTDRRTHGQQIGARTSLCVDAHVPRFAANPHTFDAARPGPEHRTHILYTSGSTGKPKGIELLARGVSRLVLATDYVQFNPGDRVAQIANFSFDAATFEVWGALLNGAALVLIPRRSALDPHELRTELRDRRISTLLLTTALFNLVAQARPDAFRSLRNLLIGGEQANVHAVRAVLAAGPPARLINAYGPTESTVIATTCDLDDARVADGVVPIGRPIANTRVYILDDDRRPVGVGETGELYIGGDGLARGYLRRPELTAERFVEVPGLVPGAVRGPTLRLYRTGDQARWRPDGAIEFLGRTDFQVKIRGFRVELGEVEAGLLATGMLNDAVVTAQAGGHGEQQLVAHVVPRDPPGYRTADLQERLAGLLPRYMIPARIVDVPALPLNANGKVDRKALTQGHAQSGVFCISALAALRDPVTAELAKLWAELLGVAEVGPDDDFFKLGGNSLLAARLVLRVRDIYQVRLPIYALYEASTLRECAAAVRGALRGGAVHGPNPDEPDAWRADACLPHDVLAAILRAADGPAAPADWRTGEVFLTGATGFLGAFMLAELLRRTTARAHCLVRATDVADGARRLRQVLTRYGLWHDAFAARIHPVVGDLCKRRFGLAAAAFDALAARVAVVFHSGAQVNYVQPYVAHRAANVGGTAEVIRFAATGRRKPLHHISSIAVFGPSGFFGGKRRVREDDDLDEYLQYLGFDIGYTASKWVAEKLVWEAIRAGLPAAVHRPGFVMGDSRTGVGNPDDFMGRCVRGSIRVGVVPDLPRQRKEFVPVDVVSRAILHIAADPANLGRAYHLVPPDPRASIDLNHFFGMIAAFGYPLARVDYAQWVERVTEDARVGDNPLCPLLPMLFERVYGDERTRWELYEDMPAYDAGNTVRALAGSDIAFPPLTRGLMTTYLRRWIAEGHLPLIREARDAPIQLQAV